MAHHRTSYRDILTRGLAVIALLCIYGLSVIGASALLLGASTTSALARGGGGRGGGGFRGGGFRGAGFGLGLGLGYPYYGYGGYYPYYGDAGVCYEQRAIPLSTAVPHIADRGLGPARAEPAAVPAPSIKTRAAIPIDRPAISRLLRFDPFG